MDIIPCNEGFHRHLWMAQRQQRSQQHTHRRRPPHRADTVDFPKDHHAGQQHRPQRNEHRVAVCLGKPLHLLLLKEEVVGNHDHQHIGQIAQPYALPEPDRLPSVVCNKDVHTAQQQRRAQHDCTCSKSIASINTRLRERIGKQKMDIPLRHTDIRLTQRSR